MQGWSALRGVGSKAEGGKAYAMDLKEVSAVSRSVFRRIIIIAEHAPCSKIFLTFWH